MPVVGSEPRLISPRNPFGHRAWSCSPVKAMETREDSRQDTWWDWWASYQSDIPSALGDSDAQGKELTLITTAKEVSLERYWRKEDRTAEEDRMKWRHSLCVRAPLSLLATGMSSAATGTEFILSYSRNHHDCCLPHIYAEVNTTQVSSISTSVPCLETITLSA